MSLRTLDLIFVHVGLLGIPAITALLHMLSSDYRLIRLACRPPPFLNQSYDPDIPAAYDGLILAQVQKLDSHHRSSIMRTMLLDVSVESRKDRRHKLSSRDPPRSRCKDARPAEPCSAASTSEGAKDLEALKP